VVDSDDVQRSVRGFAQVALLKDKWAAFKLTDCIGKELSCYNGAVRLYWPGLSRGSDPLGHPLYFPDSIRWHAQNAQPLERHLFRMLVGISGFRFSEGSIVRAASIALERQKQQRIQELLSRVAAGGAEVQEIEAELGRAWSQIDQLKTELDQTKQHESELAAELEAQKTAWVTVQLEQSTQRSISGAQSADSREEVDFRSVAEAVEKAQSDFKSKLLFLDSAVRSAKDSPYQLPNRVYELFEALGELVGVWQKKGKLGKSWKVALLQKGFDFKDSISMTSRGKHGDDYTFVYNGKKQLFENHVTLGAKTPDTCLSVHWMRDDDKKILVIGSCGRHGGKHVDLIAARSSRTASVSRCPQILSAGCPLRLPIGRR
jgi:hypothetical protein